MWRIINRSPSSLSSSSSSARWNHFLPIAHRQQPVKFQHRTLTTTTTSTNENDNNSATTNSSSSSSPSSSSTTTKSRPLTAYNLFLQSQMRELKAANPTSSLKPSEYMKEIARKWKEYKITHPEAVANMKHTTTTISNTASPSSSSSWSPLPWQIGDLVEEGNFRVIARDEITEFNLILFQLQHTESNTTFVHISRNDADCAFSVAFRTPVNDSTGVAHILEHTVLCGSERFPVRDPFFLLVRKSLKTFMNAMTAQDYTMYPFSTQNKKDFMNLAEVYLDAVFFPLLNKLDFKQEGHRLEIVNTNSNDSNNNNEQNGNVSNDNNNSSNNNAATTLQIKGVVYNEMKGAMSDTSQLFLQRLQSELFPTNSNHFNSGGEPNEIPNLTHEQLKAFHRQSYQIDNAVFFSYGDSEPPLKLVNERVIQPILAARRNNNNNTENTTNSTTSSPLPPPPYRPEQRFDQPRVIHATCPPDPLVPDANKQTKVSVSFLCKEFDGIVGGKGNASEKELESFGLSMLSTLLLDSPSSPMYQALIDPNIGSGYAPGTGFDAATVEGTFSFGLQGIAKSDVEKVIELIEKTLNEVSVSGFPQERIEAAIHQLELSLKHVRSNFGIGLLMRLIPAWVHHKDVAEQLRVNQFIEALRNKLKEGPFFQELIKKHLLNNKHRVTLIMNPDEEYTQKETAIEQAKLIEKSNSLTEADREKLIIEAKQLIEAQDKKQDTQGCKLPSLSASDISAKAPIISLQPVKLPATRGRKKKETAASTSSSSTVAQPKVLSLLEPTNGIGYFRATVNAKRVPLHLRPYLPLYTAFLTELGTTKNDYRSLSHILESSTGGISAELSVFAHLDDLNQHEEVVLFKSMALHRNIPQMMNLIAEVLYQPIFHQYERLQQLLLQSSSVLASSLQDSGSSYATSDAAQYLFPAMNASELYSGIKYVTFVNELVKGITQAKSVDEVQNHLKNIADKLQEISQIILTGGLDKVFIVGDTVSNKQLEKHLPQLLKLKSSSPVSSSDNNSSSLFDFAFNKSTVAQNSFYALPLQVNNVSFVLPSVPYTHVDAPKLDVMSKILSSVFVHREVREKGGAYGGNANNSSEGILTFSSYRDPNTMKTIDAYHAAPKWLLEKNGDNFTSTDVEEALLSLFSSIDAPKPPSTKGLGQFLFGVTNEQRQLYRDRLLSVDKKAVLDVCERYLSPTQLEKGHISIVGAETNVIEGMESKGWKIKTIDLGVDAAAMNGEDGVVAEGIDLEEIEEESAGSGMHETVNAEKEDKSEGLDLDEIEQESTRIKQVA